MWKIEPFKVCEFCILLYYKGKRPYRIPHSGNAFPFAIQKYTNQFANFTLFLNLKVCLIGEWSISMTKLTTLKNYYIYKYKLL